MNKIITPKDCKNKIEKIRDGVIEQENRIYDSIPNVYSLDENKGTRQEQINDMVETRMMEDTDVDRLKAYISGWNNAISTMGNDLLSHNKKTTNTEDKE